MDVSVDIVVKNGENITNPSYVIVNMENSLSLSIKDKEVIKNIISKDVLNIKVYANLIINKNVVREHIQRKFIYD